MSSTLFHNRFIQYSGVLLITLLFNGHLALAKCDLEKSAGKLYSNIQSRSHGDMNLPDYFSEQQKDISLLASIDSRRSNELLAKLSNLYLGESVNELVAEAITKKQKAIVPFLEVAAKEGPICSKGTGACASQAKKLLDLIKEGKTFQSEENSLKTFRKQEICKEVAKKSQK